MAGNYRSSSNNVSSKISEAMRASRSTHVRKNTLAKQAETAKSVISHREGEKRKTVATKGKYMLSREEAKLKQISERNKGKVPAKKRKVAKENKW